MTERYNTLHVLVNTAATAVPKHETVLGYNQCAIEKTFAVNVLAYYILPLLLLPSLSHAALHGSLLNSARVVNVVADYAGFACPEEYATFLQTNANQTGTRIPYDMHTTYQHTKQADAMLTLVQAAKFDEWDIAVHAANPGPMSTALVDVPTPCNSLALEAPGINMGTPSIEECASAAVWLAVAPELEGCCPSWLGPAQ